jgi:hypothetical protein
MHTDSSERKKMDGPATGLTDDPDDWKGEAQGSSVIV